MQFKWLKYIIRYGKEFSHIRKKCGADNCTDKEYWLAWNLFSKKRYVIFRMGIDYGHGYLVPTMIESFIWAEEMGFAPIVLWSEPDELCEDISKGKISNHWDYFFEQKIDYTENDTVLVGCMNAVYTSDSVKKKLFYKQFERGYLELIDDEWRAIFARYHYFYKKYFSVKDNLMKDIENEWNHIRNTEDKVLGVFLREEFSIDRMTLPKDDALHKHPWVKDVDELIEWVASLKRDNGCNKIFIATGFEDTISKFVNYFGSDSIRYIERERHNFEEWKKFRLDLHKSKELRDQKRKQNDKRLQCDVDSRMAYFKEIVICSKCDCLTGHMCSGTRLSLIMNGGKYIQYQIIPNKKDVNLAT